MRSIGKLWQILCQLFTICFVLYLVLKYAGPHFPEVNFSAPAQNEVKTETSIIIASSAPVVPPLKFGEVNQAVGFDLALSAPIYEGSISTTLQKIECSNNKTIYFEVEAGWTNIYAVSDNPTAVFIKTPFQSGGSARIKCPASSETDVFIWAVK